MFDISNAVSKRALVISPHADDEVIGCGGTIARLADLGWPVRVLVMACGGIRHRHLQEMATVEERSAELRNAARVLGVSETNILFPGQDMALDTMAQAKIVAALDREIDTFAPDIVLIPLPDTNVDHSVTHLAAMAALRPTAHGGLAGTVLGYDTATSFWGGSQAPHGWLFVDIQDQLARKIAALRCYKSQIQKAPHPVSAESLELRARAMGMACGRAVAERFALLRAVIG